MCWRSACHDEVERAVFVVDDGVDFGAPPAAADANHLNFSPLLSRWPRWAFTIVLSIR
jgi:hypothetical protein